MRKIGVEGHAVAGHQLVALAVAKKNDRARPDQRGLAAAWFVHRWVTRAAGHRARRESVLGQLRALPGERWREDLIPMSSRSRRTFAPRVAAHDVHRAVLVESQQLG